MAWQDFPLRGFCPDLPVTTPGVICTALRCSPTDRGIGAGPRITTDSTSTLSTESMGGAVLYNTSATGEAIIGTATKLYGFDLTTTLTDRSGAAYSASTTDTWSVTNFGNIALAINRNNFLQQRTIAAGANFAAVGAAPCPKASIVVTCGPVSAPFVMVFDYNDGTNNDKDGWKCSAISDYTGWTSGTNSSATGRLLDNASGPITAAIPYRDGVVAWKRGAMYVGEYTGPPNIWSWRRISSDVGCIGKNAAVVADDVVYWSDDSGIWMFDGSYPKRVTGYVQKYWAETVTTLAPADSDRNFYRTIWDKNKHIIWFLTGTNATTIGKGLAYNTVSSMWVPVKSSPFANNAITDIAMEIFSHSIVANIISGATYKIGSLHWGASGNEPAAALFTGHVIGNNVNSPMLNGIRPNWSTGPSIATSNWCSGFVRVLSAPRFVTPGTGVTSVSDVTGVFRQPGKIDVQAAGEFMIPEVDVTNGVDWEVTSFSLDIASAGRS